jgi:hypothetical protein
LTNQWAKDQTRLPTLLELSVGQHLTRYPFFLANLAWGLVLSLTLSNDIRSDSLLPHVMAVVVAQILFSLLIAAAYRANLWLGSPVRPRNFILVFLLAGAIRGAVLQFLLGALHLTTTDHYAYRVFGGVASLGLSSWFWAVLFGVIFEWRRQASQLATERAYLGQLQSEVDAQVTSATELEIDAFRTYLLTNLRLAGKADAEAVRNELTRVVNEVIRPVVDQMLLRRTAVAPPAKSEGEARINLRNVVNYVSAKRSFQPVIQVVPAIPSAIAVAFVLYGYSFGIWAFVLFVAGWPMLLALAKFFVGPKLDRLPSTLRVCLLPFAHLLTAAPVAYGLFSIQHLRGGQWVWLQFGFYSLVTGLVLSVWFAYLSELGRVYRIRDQFIHHIHWKVAEVNSRRWHQQLHFARRVHGQLQSEVAAVAIRIDQELANAHPTITDIADLQASLQLKVQQVFDAPEIGLNPSEVLKEISETWAGICQIDVQLDPADSERLMLDPIAVETALEVVREAISNAIRHGSAQQVAVAIALIDESTVRVEVSNDGKPLSPTEREGMGTKHLQECSVQFGFEQGDATTKLVADLPFRG